MLLLLFRPAVITEHRPKRFPPIDLIFLTPGRVECKLFLTGFAKALAENIASALIYLPALYNVDSARRGLIKRGKVFSPS